ncbi:MAG: sigma-70 family RNA polymerase sigma factor [Candidatus Latescibacterota bacterium]|nr:MAG: sigma-70 family RNA polymerase sigma factor [Candidatus Latescibacterota bacterium]
MSKKLSAANDTELALRAKAGDAAAFEAIYDRHVDGVARALASFAGPDRDLLDDLTQDVFYRVIDGLHSYTPRRPFAHWLYTVALNVGRNHARRSSKVIPVDPSDMEKLAANGDRSSTWIEEVIEVTLIRLVKRLPDRLRDVVSLRIGSNFTYDEIGEMLGIPAGTARSRMHNAIGILRQELGIVDQKKGQQNEKRF